MQVIAFGRCTRLIPYVAPKCLTGDSNTRSRKRLRWKTDRGKGRLFSRLKGELDVSHLVVCVCHPNSNHSRFRWEMDCLAEESIIKPSKLCPLARRIDEDDSSNRLISEEGLDCDNSLPVIIIAIISGKIELLDLIKWWSSFRD